ncbi:MAG: hypothetical protein P8J32_02905 [bacterium]|nr:hypothetical protein [bacterium]
MMRKRGFRGAARPHPEARSPTHSPGNTTQPNKKHCRRNNKLGAEWYAAMSKELEATNSDHSKVLLETAQILGEWQERGGSVRGIPVGFAMGDGPGFREIGDDDVPEPERDAPNGWIVDKKNPTFYIQMECAVRDLQDVSECDVVDETALGEILDSKMYKLTFKGMKDAVEELVVDEEDEEEDAEEEEDNKKKPKKDKRKRVLEDDHEEWTTRMLDNAKEVRGWHLTEDGRQILRALVRYMNPSEATMKLIDLLYGSNHEECV